jgi:ElaB/YqjD/DUF883 family membrane-anchored ribosome-binding protein
MLRAGGSTAASKYRPGGTSSQNTTSAQSAGLSQTASKATEYVSDVAGQAKDTVAGYATSAGAAVRQAGETVSDRSQQVFQDVQSTAQSGLDRILAEQPLAVAIAGLGLGAALAAAFPATDLERETLGPVGAEIKQAAENIGGQLKSAASAAGDEIKAQAGQRGLNVEGLKDAAANVAGAFTDKFQDADANGSGTGQRG